MTYSGYLFYYHYDAMPIIMRNFNNGYNYRNKHYQIVEIEVVLAGINY